MSKDLSKKYCAQLKAISVIAITESQSLSEKFHHRSKASMRIP